MQVAYRILSGTPLWVFPLFAYLIWQGVRSLKPRTIPAWRALIVPVLFIAMGLSRMALSHEIGMAPYLWWLAGAAFFAPLAFLTGPRLIAVDRTKRLVARPGSPVSLIRNVAVFSLQYLVAVTGAMQLSAHSWLAVVGHVVSGASAGYFAAWAGLFLKRYRAAPSSEISN